MVDYKSKYLEMKLKYINAKQKGGMQQLQDMIDQEINNPDPDSVYRANLNDYRNGTITLDQLIQAITAHYNTQARTLSNIANRFQRQGIAVDGIIHARIAQYQNYLTQPYHDILNDEVNNPDPFLQFRTYVDDYQNSAITLDGMLQQILATYTSRATELMRVRKGAIAAGIPIPPLINNRIIEYNNICNGIDNFRNSARAANDYNDLTQLIHQYHPAVGMMRYDMPLAAHHVAALAVPHAMHGAPAPIGDLIGRYL